MPEQRTPRSVTVLGDLMLDVSEHGTASRLSPEAPVVVLLNPVATATLGGAANTAANARSLLTEVTLAGVVGKDAAGDEILRLVAEAGLTSSIVALDDYPTTVKRRFLAGAQQVMRLDVEVAVPADAAHAIMNAYQASPASSSVVLSDYDKGTVSPAVAQAVIGLAQADGRPVVVDSKKRDVSCFVNCTVIAPNHHEAAAMTGTQDPERAAEIIAEVTKSGVLVTLGADGMLIRDEYGVERIPSHALDVADVTGAGDTVTAALAVALAEGATVREAARWANHAAAVAVAHAGTYAVPRDAVPALTPGSR